MNPKLERISQAVTEGVRSVTKTPLGRHMAIGAGIGAVVAVPVPFVGFLTGAILGAGIAAFRYTTRK